MIKNKVFYVLWLIMAIALFVLVDNVGTLLILILSITIPLLSILLAIIASKNTTAMVDVKGSGHKGEEIPIVLTIVNNGFLPITKLAICISCRNQLNKQTAETEIICSIGAKSSQDIVEHFTCEYCGNLSVSVKSIKIFDYLHIFSVLAKIEEIIQKKIVIVPELFLSEIVLVDQMNTMSESDIYSMEKAGNDASETFLIREYYPGDSIKNIHWKLSQKVDKTMVRELGLPIVNDVLVVFDMAVINREKLPSPKGIDTLVEVFASICHSMCQSEIQFIAAYKDSKTHRIATYDIKSADDIDFLVMHMLGNAYGKSPISTEEAYVCDPCNKNYEHVVFITANEDADASVFYNYNRVNMLLLSKDEKTSVSNAYVKSFTGSTYKEDLSILEI